MSREKYRGRYRVPEDEPKVPQRRCERFARKGTGWGTCNAPLDKLGYCPNFGNHMASDEVDAGTPLPKTRRARR